MGVTSSERYYRPLFADIDHSISACNFFAVFFTNQNTQEAKKENFLIWTIQNKVRILGKLSLRQSDERTKREKTRNVVNITLAQCHFGRSQVKSSHPRKDDVISKLDLCEGGSFLPTIFKSDIEPSVYHILCFISVCPFVALSKAKSAENVQFVLSSPIKTRSFLTSCVF